MSVAKTSKEILWNSRDFFEDLFHNILLLGCGGRTVYHGSVRDAQMYFSHIGYDNSEDINPADHYMRVIADDQGRSLFHSFEQWRREQQRPEPQTRERLTRDASVAKRVTPGFCFQFWCFLKRELLLLKRSIKTLVIDTFLVLTAGVILGVLYIEVQLEKFSGLTRMSGMAIGLTSVIASLRCFANHRTIFWRESAAGVNRVSYFLAVNFAQLPILIMMPLVYLSLLYTLTSPRSSFSFHYQAVFCAQLCCSGMGYAISTIFEPKSAQMASVVVVLIMTMLSGFSPTLCSLDKLSFFGPLAYNLSYIRWFVEALFEKEALRYPNVLRPIRDRIAFPDHYTLDNYSFCLGIIVVIALVYRLLALFFLLITNRGKQK